MRLNDYPNRNRLLVEWILEALPENARVLDIGANDGSFCPELKQVADTAKAYAGVDPDTVKLARHPFLSERYPSTLEAAHLPSESYDCLIAIFVLEHVARPHEFIRAAGRALKPGGSFFFITPNRYHYFAFLAGGLATAGLQDSVLKRLRPRELVEEYHYPALYQLNSPRQIRRIGRDAGFSEFEFRYCERLDEIDSYFPGPMKILPRAWEGFVQMIRQERLLLNLMGRIRKS
jgi:SAM-dependent methyltransferase